MSAMVTIETERNEDVHKLIEMKQYRDTLKYIKKLVSFTHLTTYM